MDRKLTDQLINARRSQTDDERSARIKKVRLSGRMTARERLDALLDPDSSVEYGTIAARTAEGDWIPEAGGIDFVGSINGQVVVASATDYTDHGGGYGAGRLGRLFALADEHRWPLVFFVDGGGSRARHPRSNLGHFEFSGPIGRYTVIEGNAQLSGWVPTIAIVSGPSFAGHASLAGFSDFLIATRGSSLGIGGPPMVEAALGKRLSANELAGVEMHELTGGIDLLVEDDAVAIAAARRYLSYYNDQPEGEAAENAAQIGSLIPNSGPYDMIDVIQAMVDRGSYFELRPRFAPALITALARMNGRTTGIIANQPRIDDGLISNDAASKIARFIELCDCYEYPIITLIDTPGCTADWQQKDGSILTEPGMTRWHARPIVAHQHRTVPLFSIIVGRSGGLGLALMTGFSTGQSVPPLCVGWPSMQTGIKDGFSAIHYGTALDDVVLPHETRQQIIRLLTHLPKKTNLSEKKHPIDSW